MLEENLDLRGYHSMNVGPPHLVGRSADPGLIW